MLRCCGICCSAHIQGLRHVQRCHFRQFTKVKPLPPSHSRVARGFLHISLPNGGRRLSLHCGVRAARDRIRGPTTPLSWRKPHEPLPFHPPSVDDRDRFAVARHRASTGTTGTGTDVAADANATARTTGDAAGSPGVFRPTIHHHARYPANSDAVMRSAIPRAISTACEKFSSQIARENRTSSTPNSSYCSGSSRASRSRASISELAASR